MAATLVQSNTQTTFSPLNVLRAVYGHVATTIGNSLIIVIGLQKGDTVVSITDTAGNNYVQIPGAAVSDSGGNRYCDAWWCASSTGSVGDIPGISDVTITKSGTAANDWGVELLEVQGLTGSVSAVTKNGISITNGSNFTGNPVNSGAGSGALFLSTAFGIEAYWFYQSVASPWTGLHAGFNAEIFPAYLISSGAQQSTWTPTNTYFFGGVQDLVFGAHVAANPPTFSLAPGTYTGDQSVSLTTTSAGANIYYTLDGSTPTTSSTLYSGPVMLQELSSGPYTVTIQAIAGNGGFDPSTVATATYNIVPVHYRPSWLSSMPFTQVIDCVNNVNLPTNIRQGAADLLLWIRAHDRGFAAYVNRYQGRTPPYLFWMTAMINNQTAANAQFAAFMAQAQLPTSISPENTGNVGPGASPGGGF